MMDDRRVKQAIEVLGDERERVMFLLSVRAGLRAVEIAGLIWANVDLEGRMLLLKRTKGDKPRHVPMASDLFEALSRLKQERAGRDLPHLPVLVNTHTKGGVPLSSNAVAVWFHRLYTQRLGWEGYSSHSGRRTFATKAARKIALAGGSIRDVQDLLGHQFLSTTQRYLDTDPEAQRKIVDMI